MCDYYFIMSPHVARPLYLLFVQYFSQVCSIEWSMLGGPEKMEKQKSISWASSCLFFPFRQCFHHSKLTLHHVQVVSSNSFGYRTLYASSNVLKWGILLKSKSREKGLKTLGMQLVCLAVWQLPRGEIWTLRVNDWLDNTTNGTAVWSRMGAGAREFENDNNNILSDTLNLSVGNFRTLYLSLG